MTTATLSWTKETNDDGELIFETEVDEINDETAAAILAGIMPALGEVNWPWDGLDLMVSPTGRLSIYPGHSFRTVDPQMFWDIGVGTYIEAVVKADSMLGIVEDSVVREMLNDAKREIVAPVIRHVVAKPQPFPEIRWRDENGEIIKTFELEEILDDDDI